MTLILEKLTAVFVPSFVSVLESLDTFVSDIFLDIFPPKIQVKAEYTNALIPVKEHRIVSIPSSVDIT